MGCGINSNDYYGACGGFKGHVRNASSGGSQSALGNGSNSGSFGLGGNCKGDWGGVGNGDNNGSRGSGFIGSSRLGSSNEVVKHMTCYNYNTSTKSQIYTNSTSEMNDSPVSSVAKRGNGYIIKQYAVSQDNYLEPLTSDKNYWYRISNFIFNN